MFAAFPGWYATMFSGFYLALVLLLVGADPARGLLRVPREAGLAPLAAHLDALLTAGSLLVAAADRHRARQPAARRADRQQQEFTGGLLDLLTPYALFFGLTLLVLCALHGATFLA